ncbi:MAG: glutaredoxin domain-containing protein [Syntrophobacteria bacterium]
MKILNALFTVFFLILIVTGLARAEIYRWVDGNGVVYISDVSPQKAESIASAETRTRPKVELYTTSWCPYCEKAREFFRSRGIFFTEYDIEKDKSAAARKNQLDKKKGVPFVVINGRGIHGWSAAAYEQALEGHQ